MGMPLGSLRGKDQYSKLYCNVYRKSCLMDIFSAKNSILRINFPLLGIKWWTSIEPSGISLKIFIKNYFSILPPVFDTYQDHLDFLYTRPCSFPPILHRKITRRATCATVMFTNRIFKNVRTATVINFISFTLVLFCGNSIILCHILLIQFIYFLS